MTHRSDHPLIRELYADNDWQWIECSGRTQANRELKEVLIVRNGADE